MKKACIIALLCFGPVVAQAPPLLKQDLFKQLPPAAASEKPQAKIILLVLGDLWRLRRMLTSALML